MSQLWVTINQPPSKQDVENYMNGDRNVVWQALLRRNEQKTARQNERYPVSNCIQDSKGENKMHIITLSRVSRPKPKCNT